MVELKNNNPLHRSIKSAYRANRRLGALFKRIGTREHPEGRVFTAYRQARRAARAIDYRNRSASVPQLRDVYLGLRQSIRATALELSGVAKDISEQNARSQATYFGIEHEDRPFPTLYDQIIAGLDVLEMNVNRQEALSVAFAIAEVEEEMIIGDDRHEGGFSPVAVANDERRWLSELIEGGYADFWVDLGSMDRLPPNLMKTAIAVIDKRTTDTCLEVNGQVARLDDPFLLFNEPRYADQMMGPPFHDNCRTMMSIYLAEYDDGITEQLRAESQQLLA